jgi:hypothetical protein
MLTLAVANRPLRLFGIEAFIVSTRFGNEDHPGGLTSYLINLAILSSSFFNVTIVI